MPRIALEAFFLHQEQILALLGSHRAEIALDEIDRRRSVFPVIPAMPQYVLASHLARSLSYLGVEELQRAVHAGSAAVGQVIGVQQAFYFRRAKTSNTSGNQPIDFHAKLNTDVNISVLGRLNAARCATESGAGNLSGHKTVYMLGTITELTAKVVTIRAAFAGIRSYVEDEQQDVLFGMGRKRRVYASQVDQFSLADFTTATSASEREAVLALPEQEVKEALASIIGEPFVPKDWGGERSDLYTSRLFIEGMQSSSAWLLKGPSFSRPMTIAALGKRGDQIDRLYSEPADVLVLQHCHQILAPVVNMMETYAFDVRRPRKFMVIDGEDTARIFKAYDCLPVRK